VKKFLCLDCMSLLSKVEHDCRKPFPKAIIRGKSNIGMVNLSFIGKLFSGHGGIAIWRKTPTNTEKT